MSPLEQDKVAIATIQDLLRGSFGEGRREVLNRFEEHRFDVQTRQSPPVAKKSVTRFLPILIETIGMNFPSIAVVLSPVMPRLYWNQTAAYTDDIFGQGFLDNYAWAELIGPHGLFEGDDFRLGFLLLGPDQHYLDHYHPAPELYVPLTPGSFWRKGESEFVERKVGELIWHPSMTIHATKTCDAPLMAMYAWTKDTATGARLVAQYPGGFTNPKPSASNNSAKRRDV